MNVQAAMQWIENHIEGCPIEDCSVCRTREEAIAEVRKAVDFYANYDATECRCDSCLKQFDNTTIGQ